LGQLALAVFAPLTPHANPTPKNALCHFSALPTHHPSVVVKQRNTVTDKKEIKQKKK